MISLACYGYTTAQPVRVMSYNIRYDTDRDGENRWDVRKPELVDYLHEAELHFLGLQEAMLNQLHYIDSALMDHTYTGVGRADGDRQGEFSAIVYDSMRYELLEGNTFWLSDNSGEVSVGWDAAMERICTWGLFRDKDSGKEIYVFNTHFDHIGRLARENSARLIVDRIAALPEGIPIVLTGDFNATPTERPIEIILEQLGDGSTLCQSGVSGPAGTWNGFDTTTVIDRRIDYVFVKRGEVTSYENVDRRRSNGLHLSDHLPVLAVIEY